MSGVVLTNLSKRFGNTVAVDDVSLTVRDGEFLTLLGPSGCGKTTTLRMIAGLAFPSSGDIAIGGERVNHLPPRKRNVGMVFQNYALFPHMTVTQNIGFSLRERGADRQHTAERVTELLKLIRLPNIGARYPDELSGGQQQRVSLARALAHSPRVLLMDEPLGALDLKLREAMQDELHRIQRALRITTVLVTHDQGEAMSLSDRIAVMSNGKIEQCAAPEEIYHRPTTPFVAQFVGKINFFTAAIGENVAGYQKLTLAGGATVAVDHRAGAVAGATVVGAVRPERIEIDAAVVDRANLLPGTVERRQFLGSALQYSIRIATGELWAVEVTNPQRHHEVGDTVTMSWKPEHTLLLEGDGAALPARTEES